MTTLPPTATKATKERDSLFRQIVSLAIILLEEFSVSFAFHDPETGEPLSEADSDANIDCTETPHRVDFQQSADHRNAQVTRAKTGDYRLVLPLGGAERPCLLAIGFLPGLAHTKAEETQEQARLQKWANSVCERIHLTTLLPVQHRKSAEHDGSSALAWESLLSMEQLMRRLRVHKDSVKHQKRILRAAAELLHVTAVIWAPQQGDTSVLVGGEALLAPFEFRELAHRLDKTPELEKSGLLIVNDLKSSTWNDGFPQITNLLAVAVRDHGVNGLLIALNKTPIAVANGLMPPNVNGTGKPHAAKDAPLRRSDALVLTTYAAFFGMHTGVSHRYHDLKELLVGMTRALTSAIDAKDTYTFGHSERVGRIAIELGRALGLSEDELNDLYLGGLMHDIGKIGIRDEVLGKRGPLTPDEMDHLKQHVTIGHAIVAELHPIRHLFPAILYHHERVDGGGYPEGLQGDAIPLIARILAVADAYDAMTTTRSYRTAMTHDRAVEILKDGAGTQWDRRVVDAFLGCREKIFIIRQRGVGESLRQAIDGALRNEASSRLMPSVGVS